MHFAPSTGNFYPEDVDYPDGLPDDAVEVTRADFEAAMTREVGATFRLEGDRIVIVPPVRPTDVQRLSAAIKSAAWAIDQCASDARSRHVTAGMETTYAAKEAEARALIGAMPGAEPGPYIAAEAAALGMPAISIAYSIVEQADAWAAIAPQIEAARQAGKTAVRAAETPEAVRAAAEAAIAALAAL